MFASVATNVRFHVDFTTSDYSKRIYIILMCLTEVGFLQKTPSHVCEQCRTPQNCDANYHDTLLVDGLVIKMHSTFNRWPKVE